MEELIASKYEDISNRRKVLHMKILMSESNVKLSEDMINETISMRRKLEKINMDYTLRKRKIVMTITISTIQKLMYENNDKRRSEN